MIPETDAMLVSTAMRLLMHVVPAIPPGYPQSSAGTAATMLLFAAQEFDRAADIRLWENAEMRGLLKRGQDWLKPADILPAASNRISALNVENHALQTALIALHIAVEGGQGSEARVMERDILAFLKASAERRRLLLPSAEPSAGNPSEAAQ